MLLAAHVRPSHVHAVVEADRTPEQVMTALKAYASRALNESGCDKAEPAPVGSARQYTLLMDGNGNHVGCSLRYE